MTVEQAETVLQKHTEGARKFVIGDKLQMAIKVILKAYHSQKFLASSNQNIARHYSKAIEKIEEEINLLETPSQYLDEDYFMYGVNACKDIMERYLEDVK